MRVTIFRGHGPDDALGTQTHQDALESLARRGWEVEDFDLTTMRIAPCTGCFDCWLKHPGICSMKDDTCDLVRSRARAGALWVLSRVTFGGYSGRVKVAMDHNVPNVLPFFIKHKGEMHHPQRYERQGLLTLGWQDRPDEESAALFKNLAERNARNMQSSAQGSAVVHGGQSAGERREAVERLLGELEARR